MKRALPFWRHWFVFQRGWKRQLSFGLLMALAWPGTAQEVLQSSPEYSREASRLRQAPPQQYNFTRAQLRDVLRFLAEDAGINYMALPESEGDQDKLITFSIEAPPFVALETVANTYGVALLLDQGVWHMRPLDDKQLIGRVYHIKYHTQEQVTAAAMSGGTGGAFGPASSTLGSNVDGSNGISGGLTGGGYYGGYGSGAQMDLQGGPVAHLASDAKELVEAVERILGIPTSGWDANITRKDVTVDDFGRDPMRMPQRTYQTADEQVEKPRVGETKPAVFWNSDTNTLYVIATRQQHQLVERYLESIDRPQPLIAVEVKLFETSKNPSKEFGIDWEETLGDGIPFEFNPATPEGLMLRDGDGSELDPNAMNRWAGYLDWRDPSKSMYPRGAILSGSSVRARIRALLRDTETTSTSYPRVLTQNNREVVIRNVINEPVLGGNTINNTSGSAISSNSIQYLPIGTTINVLPKIMSDGTIKMTLNLQVSSIIGSKIINGNEYPIASSQLFTAPLKVESGYTVAIAGLDQARDAKGGRGVPVLSRIPILGYAFKSTNRSREMKSLMMFITPTVLSNDTEGVGEQPVSVLPVRKSDPKIDPPQIYADGSLVGGLEKLDNAIMWADRQERYLRRMIVENRNDKSTLKDIELLKRVVVALENYLQTEWQKQPDSSQLALQADTLSKLKTRVFSLGRDHWRNSYPNVSGHWSGGAGGTRE